MRRLREHLIDVDSTHHDPVALLMEKYPFLSRQRVKDILSDLDGGPVLQVQDLVSYLSWRNAYGS
jgi:acyl carrier protein